jgi:uncharacterized protein YjbJ (UPF0337 family)
MDDNKKDSIGEEVSAFGERAKGDIKEATGTVTGDSSLRAEGASESATGAARQKSNRMVTGLFRDRDSAERAYGSLSTRGYSKDDVNLLMSDETRKKHFGDNTVRETELGDKALEGAGVGSAIGGTVGAVLAAIAAIGTSVALPGLGLIVAGPLAAALAGAGAGGATGGLIGALIGAGIPEERVKDYEEGIKNGGIVMGVNARSDEDAEYFESDWKNNRGEHVYR